MDIKSQIPSSQSNLTKADSMDILVHFLFPPSVHTVNYCLLIDCNKPGGGSSKIVQCVEEFLSKQSTSKE